ncbi:MAG: 9-O-acetylesterase [Prevotellaceae bacterium]|nr:9-O-acetylesterase [Prevotellaceae bacterium]
MISLPVCGKVSLHPIFGNNMVLQQKTEVSIWGKASPAKTISVLTSWDGVKYSDVASSDGSWKLTIKTPEAGGPYTITISDGKELVLSNVMIGEVWVCSGQSNMEMPLEGWGKINNYEQEIAQADFPNIRLLTVEKKTSETPSDEVDLGKGWQVCSPATVGGFSSTAYFFGRDLNRNLKIPIGLINTSWGGTIAEAWTSGESLMAMPDFADEVKKIKANAGSNAGERYRLAVDEWINTVKAKDPGYKQNLPEWASPNFAAEAWKSMVLPNLWEQHGLKDFDGTIWFRRTIIIPDNMAGKDLTLSLGSIDDNELTFFNGEEIGHTEGYQRPRIYKVPAKLVRKGKATIAVRVHDTGGNGGFSGTSDEMRLTARKGESISLAGEWQYHTALNLSELPQFPHNDATNPNRPTLLFNAMINPLAGCAIKGAIWYQGESNASRAYQYRELFPLMIADWRKLWSSDFPFYFVQLASFMKMQADPSESEWAELREAQLKTLSLINTGMAVTIDIGEADDIHPKNKQEVGRRLALIARALSYGEKLTYSGPVYKSYKVEGNKIRIYFDSAERLLPASGDRLKGFALAGPDHKFLWAEAFIDNDTKTITVSCPEIEFPVAVRYGWADNPDCNLVNEAGLPASPFRTDDWRRFSNE